MFKNLQRRLKAAVQAFLGESPKMEWSNPLHLVQLQELVTVTTGTFSTTMKYECKM